MSAQEDTTALDDQYLETVTIHDREYQKHSVENNIHLVPIDDGEIERLENLNQVFDLAFDEKLIFAPIRTPKKILDCGFGAASWAIEVAENYPGCEVIGVDISPHMTPDDTPENFWPQVDDINEPFTFQSNMFDVVNSRMVAGGVNSGRWSSYIRDIRRVLKPGGWVQMVECYYMCQSDSGRITDSDPIRQWSNKYMEALQGIKDPRAALRLHGLFTAAGLENVELDMIRLPLCAWPSGEKEAKLGRTIRDIIGQTLENLAILPFTKRLNMSIEDVKALVANANADAINPSLKPYFSLYVCIGRKPDQKA